MQHPDLDDLRQDLVRWLAAAEVFCAPSEVGELNRRAERFLHPQPAPDTSPGCSETLRDGSAILSDVRQALLKARLNGI